MASERFVPVVMAAILLGTALWGCGGRNGPGLPTAVVAGKVTFEGAPLERGRVVFLHESGPAAQAAIQSDGSYRLEATVGLNYVMVESHAKACACTYCVAARQTAHEAQGGAEPAADAAGVSDRASMMVLPTPFVPERFENHMTSGLEFEVREGAENTAEFHLTR